MFKKIKDKILAFISNFNDSHEFKPALSKIEDAPVSPLGRFMFWTIVALIFVTILWLTLGKIDIVVTARGIVIPDGESKIIQPLETGVAKEILVKEGDFVKKGQILIKLDGTAADAKLESVEKNLRQSENEAKRLKAVAKREKVTLDDEAQNDLFEQELKLHQV